MGGSWRRGGTPPGSTSGQVLESEMILRFTVTDGLITDYRVFEDSLGITRAHTGEPHTTAPR